MNDFSEIESELKNCGPRRSRNDLIARVEKRFLRRISASALQPRILPRARNGIYWLGSVWASPPRPVFLMLARVHNEQPTKSEPLAGARPIHA